MVPEGPPTAPGWIGPARRGWAWLARHSAAVMLALTASGLALGLLLHEAGAGGAGNASWAAAGGCGAAYALWAMADALRHGRIGVDVIALLALIGALAVHELLAAAVIVGSRARPPRPACAAGAGAEDGPPLPGP